MVQTRRGKSILAHIRTREFGYNTQFAPNIYVLSNRADDVEAIRLALLPGMPFDLRIAKAATAARTRALFAFPGVSLDGAEQVTLEYAWRRCSPADGITGIELGAVLPDGSIRIFPKADLTKEAPIPDVDAATATFLVEVALPDDAIIVAVADLARAESVAEMLELSLRHGGKLIGDISHLFDQPEKGKKDEDFSPSEKVDLQPNLQQPTTRFRALSELLDSIAPPEVEGEGASDGAAHDWRKLIQHATQLRDSLDGLALYAGRLAEAPHGFGGGADSEVAKMVQLQEQWLREQEREREAHAAELDRVRAKLDQALLELAKAKSVGLADQEKRTVRQR